MNKDHLPDLVLSDEERIVHSYTKESPNNSSQPVNKKTSIFRKILFLILILSLLIGLSYFWEMYVFSEKTHNLQSKNTEIMHHINQISETMASHKNIEDIKKQLHSVLQQQTTIKQEIAKISTIGNENKKAIANIKWRNKLDSDQQKKHNQQFISLQNQFNELSVKIKAETVEKLAEWTTLQDNYEKIKKQLNNLNQLKQKIADNENALQAMDNYRIQINNRIIQLENSVRNTKDSSS